MTLFASNLEALEKMMKMAGQGTDWAGMWKNVPGMPKAPFPPETMENFHREWLGLFGAVPAKDYEDLKKKAAALEAQCEELKKALEEVARGMAGMKEMPEVIKPWLELADQAAKTHVEWFSEFRKTWEEAQKQSAGPGKGPVDPD